MKISKALRRQISQKKIPFVDEGITDNEQFKEGNKKFYAKYHIKETVKSIDSKTIKFDFSEVLEDEYDDDLELYSENRKKSNKEKIDKLSWVVLSKKSFMSNLHCILRYINYFIEYFDPDGELIVNYAMLNTFIMAKDQELEPQQFINLIESTFSERSFIEKVAAMVEYNTPNGQFTKQLSKDYDPSIQLTENHLKAIMAVSCVHRFIIPIVSQYCRIKRDMLKDNPDFSEVKMYQYTYNKLISMFDNIYDVDLYNKILYTAMTRIRKTEKPDKTMWELHRNDGTTSGTFSGKLLRDMVDISHKLLFAKSAIIFINVCFDTAIKNELRQKNKTDFIEMDAVSSDNDDDSMTLFDQYLMKNTVRDELKLIHASTSIKGVIRHLSSNIGIDFDSPEMQEELKFYQDNLMNNRLHDCQYVLLKQYLTSYGCDYNAIDRIKYEDMLKAMVVMKHELVMNGYWVISQMLTAKINTSVQKRYLKKHTARMIMQSAGFQDLEDQYFEGGIDFDKICDGIKQLISSELVAVDYNSECDGKVIVCADDIKIHELIQFYKAFC